MKNEVQVNWEMARSTGQDRKSVLKPLARQDYRQHSLWSVSLTRDRDLMLQITTNFLIVHFTDSLNSLHVQIMSEPPSLVSTFVLMVLVIINPNVVFVHVHCTCTCLVKLSLLLLCVNLDCSFMMYPMLLEYPTFVHMHLKVGCPLSLATNMLMQIIIIIIRSISPCVH